MIMSPHPTSRTSSPANSPQNDEVFKGTSCIRARIHSAYSGIFMRLMHLFDFSLGLGKPATGFPARL